MLLFLITLEKALHNVFFEGFNIPMAKTHDSLQVDCFAVYLCPQDIPVGLVRVATYGDDSRLFGHASISAYVTEDRHSSLRMAAIEELNLLPWYYTDVFILRVPLAKSASKNVVPAPFGKPIFGT